MTSLKYVIIIGYVILITLLLVGFMYYTSNLLTEEELFIDISKEMNISDLKWNETTQFYESINDNKTYLGAIDHFTLNIHVLDSAEYVNLGGRGMYASDGNITLIYSVNLTTFYKNN